MDLFAHNRDQLLKKSAPLADRMRPAILDDFVGQEHIVGHGRLLRRAIQVDQLSSLIFYGPPGTGKTTLARIIANTTKAQFLSINAVLAGVKDIREAITNAREKLALHSLRTILFIDEVHRFNKAQQDALLPHVENGTLTLIGATTENPYFEVNKALVSRSRIFQLRTLTAKDLQKIANQALHDKDRGYGNRKIMIDDDALQHLVKAANGDARGVLNALELAVETTQSDSSGSIHLTREAIEDSIQQKAVLYDKDGDAHYDTISAFIKSLRGSDPDAALYWMAKMLYAGEDPRFIFRRMLILASEDVGLADPQALSVVTAAAQAFDYVGLPEGRFHLAQACLYLATAPKSNSCLAFFDAISAVTTENAENDVPTHLQDASRDQEGLGHGKGYLYPHAYRDHWVSQQYLPTLLQGKTFYNPANQGYEKTIKNDVTRRKETQIEAMIELSDHDLLASDSGLEKNTGNKPAFWEKRTAGTNDRILGQIRDQIMNLAALKKNHLVLDLKAGTGLLTLESKRQVPEGAVWALAHDQKSYDTLCSLIQNLPAFEQPQIVQTNFAHFAQDIYTAAEGHVAFDRILGRNVLSIYPQRLALCQKLISILADNGKIVLAETVFRNSQRISEHIQIKDSALGDIFLQAENEIFQDSDNPMVNWDSHTLEEELKASNSFRIKGLLMTYAARKHHFPADIDFWMRQSEPGERQSLGDHIRKKCSQKEFETIHRSLHKQLDNLNIDWTIEVCFFTLMRKK